MAWSLDEAQKVTQVPLRYELAYGGRYVDRKGDTQTYAPNPAGVGFYDAWLLDTNKTYPVPQITHPDESRWWHAIETRLQPRGWGPLSRWWPQRAQYAGTYDQAWKQETWPYYPQDFNPLFFNSAPQALQIQNRLQGDEPLELIGLLSDAPHVQTALSGYTLLCVAEDDKATLHRFAPVLDTLTIDLDAREIRQTWRLSLPKEFGLHHLVLGTVVPPPEQRGELQRLHFKREAVMPRNLEKEKIDRLSWLLGPDGPGRR